MSHKARWSTLILVAALAVSALGGCGRAAAPMSSAPAAAPADASAPAFEQPAEEMAQSSGGEGGIAQTATTSALLNRKMIARATLELVVTDANETVRQVEAILAEQGGFISAANLYNDSFSYGADSERGAQVRGNLTLRVPAEKLEITLTALEALAVQVGTRTINREDVTDQYTDNDAQLRNLRATEDELREMLAEVRAKPDAKPEDILAVHGRLMEIRGQIEQVQGRQNMLDNLIGLSTIELTLVPDAAELPVVEDGWRPAVVARDAARALVSAMQGLGTFAIWFAVYMLPILLIVLIPVVVLILLLRALLRRRRAPARAS